MALTNTQLAAGKPRRRRSESEWRELFATFEASGLSIKQFCSDQELTLSSFHLWRKKLRAAPQNHFVPLVAPSVETAAEVGGWDVELSLGEGVTLRLRRN